jgi:hypothetical protein
MKNVTHTHVIAAAFGLLLISFGTCHPPSAGQPQAHAEPPVADAAVSKAPESRPSTVIEPAAPTSLWPMEVFAQARLTTNENGLLRPDRPTIDGPLVGWIEAHNAEVNGMSLVDWIAHAHPRHARTDRTDGNRWVAHLAPSLDRPDGWPERAIPWETSSRGAAGWLGRLEEAQAWQNGEIDLTCPAAFPRTWGGPYVDRCNLLERLYAGTHRIVAGPPISPCVIRDERTGEIVRTLVELPEHRIEAEACFVTDEGGDRIDAAHNVYLARVSDLRGGR